MFKSSKVLLVVDSVEKAVKFYTEKLLFSIEELRSSSEGGIHLSMAQVRKGKFNIVFRLPMIEELAEFSMIRRCPGRSVYATMDARKDIQKYYKSCLKKGAEIFAEKKNSADQVVSFSVKDPFGLRLVFNLLEYSESMEKISFDKSNFYGMNTSDINLNITKDADVPLSMVKWLKGFGISRRVSKKYIKVWLGKVAPKQ